jgi:hypothetical protein
MLLGGDTAAWATVLSKKKRREKTAHSPTRKHASKIQKNNLPLQIVTPATPDAKGPNPYPLKKPTLLEPAAITEENPLVHLDTLVVKQHITQAPYVPLVQTIGVAVDYGKPSMYLFTKEAHLYAGSLCILFRKNIQLSGTLGYQKLAQERSMGNKSSYAVAGYYGNIGLDYFVFYNPRNNLYAGLRYGRSDFKNSTTPASPTEQITSKNLTASW